MINLSQARKAELEENLNRVHDNIRSRANDKYPQARLVCVSKNHPLEDILLANELGESNFGENRVQEMLRKQNEFLALPKEIRAKYDFKWHFIGRLQRNKVKDVVGLVEMIHSVDSLKLLRQINKISRKRDLVTSVLIQVNISKEESKQGFEVENLADVLKEAQAFKHVKLRGLMTMAPYFENEDLDKAGQIFAMTRELLEKYQGEVSEDFNQLSMGMSHDFTYALDHGTTYIRIGTDIFGQRDYK